MPRIPTRDEYGQAPSVQSVGTPSVQPMPSQAFGADIGVATDRLGQTMANLGSQLAIHALDIERQNKEKQALQLDIQYKQRLSEVADELNQREYDAAEGIAGELQLKNHEITKELLDGVKDQDVKGMVSNLFSGTFNPHYAQVVKHQAIQLRASIDRTYNSAIDNNVFLAKRYTNPQDLESVYTVARAITEQKLANSKAPTEVVQKANTELAKRLIGGAIDERIDLDPEGSKKTIDYFKGKIDPAIILDLENKLDGKMISVEAKALWDGPVQLLRNAENGLYDHEKVREEIDALPDMSQDRKDKIYSDVKGRMVEGESNYTKGKAGDVLAAMNEAVKMKAKGVPIDKIRKQIVGTHSNYGPKHQYDIDQDIVRMFNDQVIDDANERDAAFWGINAGSMTIADLRKMRDENKLSQAHYETLAVNYLRKVQTPNLFSSYPTAKMEIENILDKNVGKSKEKRKTFMENLHNAWEAQGGGTAKGLIDLAREEAKATGKFLLWDTGTQSAIETKPENLEAVRILRSSQTATTQANIDIVNKRLEAAKQNAK